MAELTKERLQQLAIEDDLVNYPPEQWELNEMARQLLASMEQEPVAEIVSIYGDPEAFGEREIKPLVGIQKMPYGTKLYAAPQLPQPVPDSVANTFIAAIEKEQDRLHGEDYLMDSRDCIDVIREEIQRLNACRAAMLHKL